MFTLLVVTVFAYITTPAIGSVYNGSGDFYFTYSGSHIKRGAKAVYKPELPDLYAKPNYEAYLGFVIAEDNNGTIAFGLPPEKKLCFICETKYDGWTIMEWNPYGSYYFAAYLQQSLIEYHINVIMYGVDIFSDGQLVYSDGVRYLYKTTYPKQCTLDSARSASDEYLCSQALGIWYETSTSTSKPTSTPTSVSRSTNTKYSHWDDTVTADNDSNPIIIGVVVPSMVLVMAIIFGCCVKRHKMRRNRESQPTPVQHTASRVRYAPQQIELMIDESRDRSRDSADSPPGYATALQSSLPTDSAMSSNPNSLDLEGSGEKLPSYDSAVNKLRKEKK